MAIYDREYAFGRQQRSGWLGLSVTAWLIIINVAVFVIDGVVLRHSSMGIPVQRQTTMIAGETAQGGLRQSREYFKANGEQAGIEDRRTVGNVLQRVVVNDEGKPVGTAAYVVETPAAALGHFSTHLAIMRIEVWRFITFQFLHANFLHILFNMLGLWVFGRLVEEHLGRSRYLAFYLVCGVFGALMYLVLNGVGNLALAMGVPALPGLLFNSPYMPLVGASAGVFGVIMACAYIAPNMVVQLLIPPVPLRMKIFAYTYVGIALGLLLLGSQNAGGEAAHVGGAAAGFFFIRRPHLLRDFFAEFRDIGSRFKRKPPLRLADAGEAAPAVRVTRAADPLGDELRAEMDRILAKSAREGASSLSTDEQATLRKATDLLNRSRP